MLGHDNAQCSAVIYLKKNKNDSGVERLLENSGCGPTVQTRHLKLSAFITEKAS